MINIFNVKKILKILKIQKRDPILCNQQERISYIPLSIQMKTEEML